MYMESSTKRSVVVAVGWVMRGSSVGRRCGHVFVG